MSNRKLSRWGRKRSLSVRVGSAFAIIAGASAWPVAAGAATTVPAATTASAATTVKLSAAPLGLDIAPWDPLYSNATSLSVIQPLLKKAGIDEVKYGGGVTADYYNWKTQTDISTCPSTSPAEFTAKCAQFDALSFAQFSKNARGLGAQSTVTVNFGTGTPALAASWVKHAKTTAGEAVAQWEVGNENYGCWEPNNYLAAPPASYKGYKPGVDSTCPMNTLGINAGMTDMANTYAKYAKNFMVAMKQQNSSAQLGVPWAFDSSVGGASVQGNTIWNNTVLKTDAKYISFVDAHWYPLGNVGANPSAQSVLQTLKSIPSAYGSIRKELAKYVPSAKVIVGETGVSYLATNVTCTPTGAVFAAGDVLSWLAAGAQTVDWWPLETDANLGSSCKNPDEGMFTGAAKPKPLTPYMGYLLASQLARPNAHLQSLSTTDKTDVLAFQSVLPNGKVAVALLNTNTSAKVSVKFSASLKGALTMVTYSAGNQNAMNTRTTSGKTSASKIAGGVTLPAESIVILHS